MFTKAGKRRWGSSLREEGATDCTDQHGSFARPPSAAGKFVSHENTRIDTKEYIIKPFSCVFV